MCLAVACVRGRRVVSNPVTYAYDNQAKASFTADTHIIIIIIIIVNTVQTSRRV